jgi:GntR family transcriptional repressor for pyruvate dehydrogenase complex
MSEAMDFSSVSVVRPYEQIVKQIQQAIRDGQLPRGTKLPTERELAERFGVSRSVVREAIKVLDTMGLVESRQGSGSFVRNSTIESVSRAIVLSVSPDAESVEKLFEFRQILESQAAGLAAQRRSTGQAQLIIDAANLLVVPADPNDWLAFGHADGRLHEAIAEATGNPYLQVAVATARDMLQDVAALFVESKGSIDIAIEHHHRIAAAIVTQDTAAAVAAMTEHIVYTADVVQSQLAKDRSPTIPVDPGQPISRP